MNNGHRCARCCRAGRAPAARCRARRRPCTLDQLARSEREAWKNDGRLPAAGGRWRSLSASCCSPRSALRWCTCTSGAPPGTWAAHPSGRTRPSPVRAPGTCPPSGAAPRNTSTVCASLCASAGVGALCAAARRCQRASCLARVRDYCPAAPAACRACHHAEGCSHCRAGHSQRVRDSQARTPCAETGLIMHYYGIPAVSLRDVWFHKWARNEPGFRQRDVICNINHPNLLGHQCGLDRQWSSLQSICERRWVDARTHACAQLPVRAQCCSLICGHKFSTA